jgi:hypothetical protein
MLKRSGKPDANEIAFRVVQESTRDRDKAPVTPAKQDKDPAAVALGRRGGLKGGRARAEKLTKEQLSEIGRQGAKKRWQKKTE